MAWVAFALAWPAMVLPTWAVTRLGGGLYVAWSFATLYICLLSAVFANWLALRIYEDRPLIQIGLWLNRLSLENLLIGLPGAAGWGIAIAPLAWHRALAAFRPRLAWLRTLWFWAALVSRHEKASSAW